MALLSTLTNVILIMLGFTLLIFVHELGHFIAAKWAGIRTEGFAIGMGPVVASFRRGLGWTAGSSRAKVIAKTGKPPESLTEEELKRFGLGETEYSLRVLPLGGFVKMLGQEDANPNAVSDDPRSYQRCPIGKRMVVVSAGVIMNLILAVILFVCVFMVGVKLTAPIIGEVEPTQPAGLAVATNAAALGITSPGLKAGDRVLSIDGKPATTFDDVQIASATGRPDRTIEMVVERPGVSTPLTFQIFPKKNKAAGVPSIGINPAAAASIDRDLDEKDRIRGVESAGLNPDLLKAGTSIETADGDPVTTWSEVVLLAQQGSGEPIATTWRSPEGEEVAITIPVEPTVQNLRGRRR